MHPFGNDPAKIEGYNRFWNRNPVDRPLVGFTLRNLFVLWESTAAQKWKINDFITPDMITSDEFLDDLEKVLSEGEMMQDDIIRCAVPFLALRWFCGFLGSKLQILQESIFPHERKLSWEEIEALTIDFEGPWFKKYIEFTRTVVARSNGRYPVCPAVFLGPSDVGAILRGHTQMVYDLHDEPRQALAMFRKIKTLYLSSHAEHRKYIPRWFGGFGDGVFQLWAPEPIIRMQEDNAPLFSPYLFKKFIIPGVREMAASSPYNYFHLHSTSMFILDLILEVEEIRACQMNVEPTSGFHVKDMMKYFKRVQEANRSLIIRTALAPDELRMILDTLDPAGLYIYIMATEMKIVERLKKILDEA
jgi:hypothetical protein